MNNTMKRLLLSVWLLSLSLLSAVAENYPYKSDVLWVTVPNHADWLYKTGEKVTVEVQFYKYGIPRDNVTVTYEIGGDMMPVADTKGSKEWQGGDSCGNNERAGIPRLPPESNRRWKDLFTSYQSRIFTGETSPIYNHAFRFQGILGKG